MTPALCTRCGRNPPGPLTYNVLPENMSRCSECRDHASRRPEPSERKHRAYGRTESVKRLSKRSLKVGAELYPLEEHALYERPRTRGDCLPGGCNAERPCPWVSCKHHLALDVNERTGSIKHNFPDVEVWEMGETCALDVADRGGSTLEETGDITNLTRERIRQIETKAFGHARPEAAVLLDYLDSEPEPEPQRAVTSRGKLLPRAAVVNPADDSREAAGVRHRLESVHAGWHAELLAAGWRPVQRGRSSGFYRSPGGTQVLTVYESIAAQRRAARRAA